MIDINKLLFNEIVQEGVASGILFHGSGMDFEEFDTSKSTSATEAAHHGYGTYLVDSSDTAMEYVKNYAVGGRGVLYTCRVSPNVNIVEWDEMIPMDIFLEMAEELMAIDESLAEEMKEYPENYNSETFTYGDLYEIMKSVDGYENPNMFFQDYGIDGFMGSNRINPDSIEYCIFDQKAIKILNKDSVKGI